MTGPNEPYRPPNDPFSKTPPGSAEGSGAFSGPPGGYGSPAYGEPAGGPAFGGSAYGASGGYGYGTPAPAPGGPPVGPAGEWLGPPLATWGIRAGGYLLDTLIVFGVVVVLGLVSESLANVAQLGLFLYFGYLTGTTGQTPGRRALGIKVVRLSDGQLLGPGAGIGRAFLHILDALPLLLGYFWPIWDKKNQTFADKIIGSVVIKL